MPLFFFLFLTYHVGYWLDHMAVEVQSQGSELPPMESRRIATSQTVEIPKESVRHRLAKSTRCLRARDAAASLCKEKWLPH